MTTDADKWFEVSLPAGKYGILSRFVLFAQASPIGCRAYDIRVKSRFNSHFVPYYLCNGLPLRRLACEPGDIR